MKLVKLFGLAMIAAVAAMAFIGAGTASAMLCKRAESPCLSANEYKPSTTVLVSSEATKLTASFATVVCKSHATLVHEGLNANKELFGRFTLLDWTGCTGCTEVTTTALGTFRDKLTTPGNGELLPEGTTVLLKNCPLGAECTARANNETKLLLKGGTFGQAGETAEATANTKVAVSGFGCGTTGTWVTETGKPYRVLLVQGSGEADLTTGELFEE